MPATGTSVDRCDQGGDRHHRREHYRSAAPRSVAVEHGVVGSYVHDAVAPGLGKIGVLVGLESTGKAERSSRSASRSPCISPPPTRWPCAPDELDPEVVARERAIFAEQARESGKPEAIIEKMVEGRMRKFYEEVVLLRRPSWSIPRRPSSRR